MVEVGDDRRARVSKLDEKKFLEVLRREMSSVGFSFSPENLSNPNPIFQSKSKSNVPILISANSPVPLARIKVRSKMVMMKWFEVVKWMFEVVEGER